MLFIGIQMSFQKYKTNTSCVGGRHPSATKNIYCDITSKGSELLIGFCSVCNRRKSLTVSDNTKQADAFGDLFMNFGKKGPNV